MVDPVERRLNGSLLRDIRKVRRLDQAAVARALNISTGKVSQVENGDADYHTNELRAFSGLADVDFVDLLCWMGFATDRARQSYRDWYRGAHATSGAGIHAPRSSAAQSADDQVHSSATRAKNRLFLGHHAIRTADQRYAAPVA